MSGQHAAGVARFVAARRRIAVVGLVIGCVGALATAPAPLHAQLAPAPGGTSSSPLSPPLGGTSTTSAAPTAGSGQGLLAPAPPPVRGRYLDATPSVIRDAKTGKVTLAVDVAPKPGMRVYAPGNEGYAAVALTVDNVPVATVGSTVYPPAENYLFAPLNERFKVYTSTFRLTRELTVGGKTGLAAGGTTGAALVVSGKLDYQACDDKVCYLQQTLPLTWSVAR